MNNLDLIVAVAALILVQSIFHVIALVFVIDKLVK